MALRSTLMDDTYEHRRERLQQLLKEQFGDNKRALARAAHISSGQLHDKLNKRTNLGELVARRIEERLGLPAGWLDQPIEWQARNGDRRQSQAKKPKRLQRAAA